MDGLVLIFLLLIALLLVVAVPCGISILIYRLLKNKGFDKRLRLFALAPIITTGYFVFTAFSPTEEFYKEDFEEVIGVEFPKNGEILYKSASYPDHFGDYTSVSLVRTDKQFYDSLTTRLLRIGFKENDKEDIGLTEQNKIKEQIGDKKITKEYSLNKSGGLAYYVGLLSDNETLIVQRISW